eukprot:gene10090-10968_t
MFLFTSARRIPSQLLKGCLKQQGSVLLPVKRSEILLPIANFSRIKKKKPVTKTIDSDNALAQAPPPPAPVSIEEAWVEVQDKTSGQIYWWNTVTNETTALGAPRPTGPTALAQPQQQGSMGGGLGSVVAEGFAFGAGSAVAHRVVGSFFGGGDSGHSDNGGGGFDGSDDSFDI